MQTLTTGSLQQLKFPAVDIRAVSLSAPQLTIKQEKLPPQRLTVFPTSFDHIKPGRCEEKLFTADQILTLGTISSAEGVSFLNNITQNLSPQSGSLLYSVFRWAKAKDFDSEKTIVLLTIYLKLFQFFLDSPWSSQKSIYLFFKESLLRNTIQHPPKSARIFKPDESKATLLNFCHNFLTVLPLLRLNCISNNRIHVIWEANTELKYNTDSETIMNKALHAV